MMTDFAPLSAISTSVTKGSTPTTYGFQWQMSGIPFLRSECVSERGLDLRQSMFISDGAHRALRRSQVADGDILMTITGNVGRVIRLDGVDEANINQHIARIRVVDDRFDGRFVYHYLSQNAMRAYYESIVTGQAYPQISLAQVRATQIPILALGHQRNVAEALSGADALIATLEHLVSKKEAMKHGLLQELLTGRTRLPGFDGECTEPPVGDVTTWLSGGTPHRGTPAYWNGTVPWISATTLKTTLVRESPERLTPAGLQAGSRLAPTGASLVLVRGMALHRETRIGLATRPVSFNQDVKALVPHATLVPEFLLYALQARGQQILDLVSSAGSGTGVIDTRLLRRLPIWVPDGDEQRAVARVISDADDELAAVRARLEKANAIKEGMMQELLTGRTRLPIPELAGAADADDTEVQAA